jgi:hypothetical protein
MGPFRYRHDVTLVRQRRWYLEAVAFSSVLVITTRAVRGMLEWSSATLAETAGELAVVTAVVLAVTAVYSAPGFAGHRFGFSLKGSRTGRIDGVQGSGERFYKRG